MKKEYDYIIAGAGLCGLVLAKELSKRNKRILILERGDYINKLGSVWRALFFYDKAVWARSQQGIIIYRVFGVGGTSVVSCGNAVEFTQDEYNKIGIDFKKELGEAKQESCVRENGLQIGKASAKIMEAANRLGYDMRPMPKFSITGSCVGCGDCVVGCKYGAKWTSRECLNEISRKNFDLITGFFVKRIITSGGKAIAIEGRDRSFKTRRLFADKIILSAGGIGTPLILQNSGIEAGDNLFVDLYNVTYGISKEFNQRKELVMSVVCDKFHKTEGFVVSPFVDVFAGFISSVEFHHLLKTFNLNRIMGIMTKIADDNVGRVHSDGKIDKVPTESDLRKLNRGSELAKEILIECGVDHKSIFITRPRGAHPGGTAGIGKIVNNRLETKVKNLYVCDASALPFAPGLPPMLTLIALTKWFGKNIW